MQLNNRLHRLDGNFVELYLLVCKLCRLLSTLPTIRVRDNLIYDIQDLVNSQREVLKEKSAMRYGIMEELINHLSKEGEAYLQKALDTVPGTMSLGEYQNARINAKSKNKPLLKSYFDTNKTLKSLNYPFEEEIATTFNGATDAVLETPRNLEKSVLDFKNSNISYTERSALRNNCRKLATFLRLTDFMVRDALYDSVENALFVFEKYFVSLSNLVQGVATNNSSGSRPARADFSYHRPSTKLILPKAFLKIKVTIQRHQEYVATPNYNELGSSIDSLDGSTTAMLKQLSSTVDQYDEEEVDRPLEAESFVIALSPAKEDILEKFEEVINGAINSGRFTDSVCADPRCTRLLKPIEADNLYMELMDRMNREFDNSVNKLRNQCWQRLLQDLQRCHANVSGYNSLCMNYSRHRMVYQKAQRFRLAHDSKDEIADELSRLDKDLEMCNSIPDKHIFGLYQVEYGDFRLLLRQQVKQCKELYHKLIPDLYLVNGDKLNSELANYASTLSLKFTTLEDFVSVVAVFNKAVDCSDDLTSRFTTLESLRELMESSRIYVSEAVHRQAITLRQLWNRFSQLVGDFATAMDENIVVYHNQLKNRVHQLLRPITSADQYLSSNEVANPDTTPETVLIQLSLYKQELEDIQREGAVLEEYQNVLKVSVYNKHTVHDMVELIDANLNLWKIVESTKEMLISYMAVNFLDAASDEVERHIHYSTKILNTSVAQSNSRVSSWLSNSLGELRIIAPVVRKLQSSSLRDEHVDKIHDILGRKIFDEGDVTVGELVDVVKIKSYQTDLDAIYEESVLQYNLEQRLHSAIRHCKALELVYETDRDNRSLSFTTNLESIGTDFQDIRISIESCLQSKYCLPFCEEFITFCAQLTLWIELTESLKFVQEGYIRVRVLFTNARTARYLNQSLKFFKIIDETWRLILNAAKEVAKVVDFYEFPTLKDYLSRCIKAVKEIDLNVRNYLDEQSMKWPKLYLLDSSQLYDIFDTQDPRRTFQKCKILFPFSDDVVFGSEEIFNAVAIMSCGEIMKLKKPCSSRNSVVDWLRAIENNLGEQVKEEIQKFLRGEVILVDNVRNPATSEQSRFAFVQIKFWQEYMQAFHAPSLDKKQKLLQLLGKLRYRLYSSYFLAHLSSFLCVCTLKLFFFYDY